MSSEGRNQNLIVCPDEIVKNEWIDYNGHLNMAFYNVLFDKGVDFFYEKIGVGEEYTRSAIGSVFTLEVHLQYLQELNLHDRVRVHLQLLDFDEKRLHFFEYMYHAEKGYLAATSEQLAIHVDMKTRKSAPFSADALKRLRDLHEHHRLVQRPEATGKSIGLEKASRVTSRNK